MTANKAVYETNLPGLPPPRRGKVRDVYDLGEKLLIVSTDRISAFDCILPTPIPDKGKVLNELSESWFNLPGLVPIPKCKHHLITTDVAKMGHGLEQHADILRGRSMLVRKARVFPVECVVRGYLTGTGLKDYNKNNGLVCGHQLSRGLKDGSRLDTAIFTPSTKADTGHDRNISFDEGIEHLMNEMGFTREEAGTKMEMLRYFSTGIYTRAAEHALIRGIIIADTKFEFGLDEDGNIVLIDEVLTPDSSRFWPKDQYTPGQTQFSFDKQFVRDYLSNIGWDKEPPAPVLPEAVVAKTREKYIAAYEQLTGKKFVA